MVEEADGFKIAERDLEIRGPGEFLGRASTAYRNSGLIPGEHGAVTGGQEEVVALIKRPSAALGRIRD